MQDARMRDAGYRMPASRIPDRKSLFRRADTRIRSYDSPGTVGKTPNLGISIWG